MNFLRLIRSINKLSHQMKKQEEQATSLRATVRYQVAPLIVTNIDYTTFIIRLPCIIVYCSVLQLPSKRLIPLRQHYKSKLYQSTIFGRQSINPLIYVKLVLLLLVRIDLK